MEKIWAVMFLSSVAASCASEQAIFLDPKATNVVATPPAISGPKTLPAAGGLPAAVVSVMRLRHESPKAGGVVRIDHGTGALVDGLILTARHVVAGQGNSLCEIDDNWVPCRIIAEDADIDIAILEPVLPVKPKPYAVIDGCHSSVKGSPIAVLPARKKSTLWMEIAGFHHGASGSPVIHNGRVIAVAVAMRSETESNSVQIVPYAHFADIWELARSQIAQAINR